MSMESIFVKWYVDSVDCSMLLWAWWSCFSPLAGPVSSEALCCPLLVNAPLPSRQRRAGMDIWLLSITTLTGVWVIPSSPTLLHSLLSVFPPSIKTDKVRPGLISPVADNRSLARPTKKLLFHHNRWQSEVISDNGCCYLMLHLFHAFSLSQFS